MQLAQICVATVTLARDSAEEALIRDAATALAASGASIVVGDGGSPPSLVAALGLLPRTRVVAPRERGLVHQVKAAVAAALESDARFVLYTESDKATFFRAHLQPFVASIPEGADLGVGVAARDADAFATFPPLQRFTESTINRLTGDVVGQAADYSYGPFLMRRELAVRVLEVPEELGWGWRHFIFALGARLRYRTLAVTGPYACPPGQRHEGDEERIHRLRQLAQNIQGLVEVARAGPAVPGNGTRDGAADPPPP